MDDNVFRGTDNRFLAYVLKYAAEAVGTALGAADMMEQSDDERYREMASVLHGAADDLNTAITRYISQLTYMKGIGYDDGGRLDCVGGSVR